MSWLGLGAAHTSLRGGCLGSWSSLGLGRQEGERKVLRRGMNEDLGKQILSWRARPFTIAGQSRWL